MTLTSKYIQDENGVKFAPISTPNAINALETVEAVEAYDFTMGYPERLTFEI